MRIAVAILAAGKAERFGRQKLLEALRGRSLLEHVLQASQAACEGRVLLVTGKEPYAHLAARYAARAVHNPRSDDGMGTSIAAAAAACDAATDALVIVLGDQPLVTAAHLRTLMDTWDGEPRGIVATSYAGTQGPPVLFGSAYFSELALLGDDSGAKAVLCANRGHVRTVRFEPAAVDIDTPGDMARLRQSCAAKKA